MSDLFCFFFHRSRSADTVVQTSRGDAAATTWKFRGDGSGDGSRRRRGYDVEIPWMRVAATPWQQLSPWTVAELASVTGFQRAARACPSPRGWATGPVSERNSRREQEDDRPTLYVQMSSRGPPALSSATLKATSAAPRPSHELSRRRPRRRRDAPPRNIHAAPAAAPRPGHGLSTRRPRRRRAPLPRTMYLASVASTRRRRENGAASTRAVGLARVAEDAGVAANCG